MLSFNPVDVEHYRTFSFSSTLQANESRFEKTIALSFQPDLIVLNHVGLADESVETDLLLLSTDIVEPSGMCSVKLKSDYSQLYNIPFQNHRPINGTYSFWLSNLDGSATTHDGLTQISVSMSFIKYHVL